MQLLTVPFFHLPVLRSKCPRQYPVLKPTAMFIGPCIIVIVEE